TSGLGKVWTACVEQGVAGGSICTELRPWLVKVNVCGRLLSPTLSAPKSNSAVDGLIRLKPVPLTGTAKAKSVSGFVALPRLTERFAVMATGQLGGGAPAGTDMDGNHGQPCCGEKVTVIEQLCCGARENGVPGAEAHVSCSL